MLRDKINRDVVFRALFHLSLTYIDRMQYTRDDQCNIPQMIKLPNVQKGFPAAGVVHSMDSLKRHQKGPSPVHKNVQVTQKTVRNKNILS